MTTMVAGCCHQAAAERVAAREQDMDRTSLRLLNDVLKADKYAVISKTSSTPSTHLLLACVSANVDCTPRFLIAVWKADNYDAAENSSRFSPFRLFVLRSGKGTYDICAGGGGGGAGAFTAAAYAAAVAAITAQDTSLHKTFSMGHLFAAPVADSLPCAPGGKIPAHVVLTQTPACMALACPLLPFINQIPILTHHACTPSADRRVRWRLRTAWPGRAASTAL